MFAPRIYRVNKIPLSYIAECDYSVKLSDDRFMINQQDNMMFRQIRLITKRDDFYNPFVVFVECDIHKGAEKIIERLVNHGFKINGILFFISERSASMTRNGILSFIDSGIYEMVNRAITMEIEFEKTVLSKYLAYRGLMFSSCHMLLEGGKEPWVPKIIIVKDYEKVIEGERIKYLTDEDVAFVDKAGNPRIWKQKKVVDGIRDVKINCFDGCGICHPNITAKIAELIGIETPPTTFILRAPYMKGAVCQLDYSGALKEMGIEFIQDIWGKWHDVNDEMMILTESMFKGIKYFKSWDQYWDMFYKYHHCLGVAKWNFTADEEPRYTRANYQILQDLKLPYDRFKLLAERTLDYYGKIMDGDKASVYTFLGLRADKQKDMNSYMKGLLKNDEMINEECTRNYFKNLLNKKIDEAKCGKIYVDGCFRFLMPDLIAFLQYIGGIEPQGFLGHDEFWTQSKYKKYSGEYLIERNPHLSHSEHTILRYKSCEFAEKYLSHLYNVAMINIHSLTTCRLNGADFDGDLCMVIDEPIMIEGVDRNVPITLDIEDKVTALSEPFNKEGIYNVIIRNSDNRIGDYSNYATCYHNKQTKTPEQRAKYDDYVSLLSISTGKEIDKSKTGVSFTLPKIIVKYAKPLPYFMKYASPYYRRLSTWNKAYSNMNRLCMDIERWQRKKRYSRAHKFNYSILKDNNHPYTEDEFYCIEEIFLKFDKEMRLMRSDQYKMQNYDKYKDYILEEYNFTKKDAEQFRFDWDYYDNKVKAECVELVPDVRVLANICVDLCYVKYPKKKKKFVWTVAQDGVLENLKSKLIEVPISDENGDIDILGKKYSMVNYLYYEEEKDGGEWWRD